MKKKAVRIAGCVAADVQVQIVCSEKDRGTVAASSIACCTHEESRDVRLASHSPGKIFSRENEPCT